MALMHEELGFYLEPLEEDLEFYKENYEKIALSELAAYGFSFAPLFSEPGKSGLYFGKVETGKTL